ncbi:MULTISPECIES: lysozyme inhibitor LprI family protein [Roseobacteraceae]|uniref:Lysozyme inhibitor LprI-like N-terminal domain-containing protein n=1 Tax=Pseudosulfitobacter pseudonitzschiae TaxID=1402135 RepID=A0A221K1I5_9RHOB|nr:MULTISPECIES: lysozyme inhibitor LprI family protein [Roseobacteraceae]ASM72687.1 hypothetical protein SULPSESMR1_01879 [Pseudosulfitobacter pseudonitzschiae]
MLLKRALIATVLAAPVTPLAAQDLAFTSTITASCLSNAPDMAGQMACIGTSANACMEDTPGGFSTVGMSGCLDRELQYWDAKLNENYGAARTRARADDDYLNGTPSETALRDMQRAWITFRDATCDYERAQWGGGTGGGPATVGCLMRLTAMQALYLADSGIGE